MNFSKHLNIRETFCETVSPCRISFVERNKLRKIENFQAQY